MDRRQEKKENIDNLSLFKSCVLFEEVCAQESRLKIVLQ